MSNKQLFIRLVLPVLAVLTLVSCSNCSIFSPVGSDGTLTVLTYNTQNLFDDTSDGTEYPEFDPSGDDWNTRLYHMRLQNLSEVLREAVDGGPDVVALQEVENLGVIETLAGQYLKGLGYRYRICVSAPGSAVNTAVLSRLPVDTVISHRLDGDDDTVLRNVLEVHIETDGGRLILFNNHWKSKLGGAAETEEWRIRTASLVCRRIRELKDERPGTCILLTGDLNENPDEYHLVGQEYRTALLPSDTGPWGEGADESIYLSADSREIGVSDERVVLYTPWGEMEGGSYFHGAAWERIDHFLMNDSFFDGDGIEYVSAKVVGMNFLLTEDLYPRGWSSRMLSGYSDHLPLLLYLSVTGR